MSHDAYERPLAARIRSLDFAAGSLEDLKTILAELADRTETCQPAQPGCHDSEYQELLDRAHCGDALPLRPVHHARPQPPYLRVITGGLAAITAAAVFTWRWVTRSGAHQFAAAVLAAATVTAAAVPVATAFAPHPADPRMGSARQVTGHHPAPAVAPGMLACPPRRRRPDTDDDDAVRGHHRGPAVVPVDSPQPGGSPSPAGSPTDSPTPSPSPTVSPSPSGSPSPGSRDDTGRRGVVTVGWSLRAPPPI